MAEPRTSIVVLGMHRSGTSVVTRLVVSMGAYFGPDDAAMPAQVDNPFGFWERLDVHSVCDELLHAAGSTWWSVADFSPEAVPHEVVVEQLRRFDEVVVELDEHVPWVVKDPRLCVVAPLMLPRLRAPVCLHVRRDPSAVAESLRVRNGLPLAVGAALWEEYNVRAVAASAGIPSVEVWYEDLLADPEAIGARLCEELGSAGVSGLRVPSAAELRTMVTPTMAHHDPELQGSILNANQRALRDALRGGTDVPGNGQASASGRDLSRAFARFEIRGESPIDDEIARLRAEVAELEVAVRVAEQVREHERDLRHREVAELREEVTVERARRRGELRAVRESALRELGRAHRQLSRVESSRAWQLARRLRSRPPFIDRRPGPSILGKATDAVGRTRENIDRLTSAGDDADGAGPSMGS